MLSENVRARGTYSQRRLGPVPRVEEDLTEAAWGGMIALVESLVRGNDLAMSYPERCDDKPHPAIGTDERLLALAVADHAPPLTWPLDYVDVPAAATAMDLIEFVWSHVALGVEEDSRWHPFFNHYHLEFDQVSGRRKFSERVNALFARHGLAYKLKRNGVVERVAPPGLDTQLSRLVIRTGDSVLDRYLSDAVRGYAHNDPVVRTRGLKDLWDAFERVKTLRPGDKKKSVSRLLTEASRGGPIYPWLEKDGLDLTKIGDEFQIRHSEVGKHPIDDSAHVDYLFGRAFSWVWLVLRAARRTEDEEDQEHDG